MQTSGQECHPLNFNFDLIGSSWPCRERKKAQPHLGKFVLMARLRKQEVRSYSTDAESHKPPQTCWCAVFGKQFHGHGGNVLASIWSMNSISYFTQLLGQNQALDVREDMPDQRVTRRVCPTALNALDTKRLRKPQKARIFPVGQQCLRPHSPTCFNHSRLHFLSLIPSGWIGPMSPAHHADRNANEARTLAPAAKSQMQT